MQPVFDLLDTSRQCIRE